MTPIEAVRTLNTNFLEMNEWKDDIQPPFEYRTDGFSGIITFFNQMIWSEEYTHLDIEEQSEHLLSAFKEIDSEKLFKEVKGNINV